MAQKARGGWLGGRVRLEREEGLVLERFDAFLFDLDGVVCLGNEPLPRAKESLARLRRAGKGIRFLTNDPRPTRAEISARLRGMGIEVRAGEVVSSGWATAGYLAEEGVPSAYVVGSGSLESEIRGAGIEVAEAGDGPGTVVVGTDERASYGHVEAAARLISGGARFVATNPDGSFPAPGGRIPGTGALVAAVAAASGRRPDAVVGKPNPWMFELALGGLDASPDRIAVVGDNPETDVLGAHRTGLAAILVSKSLAVFPSPRDYRIPEATIPDLSHLLDPGFEVGTWESPPLRLARAGGGRGRRCGLRRLGPGASRQEDGQRPVGVAVGAGGVRRDRRGGGCARGRGGDRPRRGGGAARRCLLGPHLAGLRLSGWRGHPVRHVLFQVRCGCWESAARWQRDRRGRLLRPGGAAPGPSADAPPVAFGRAPG